MIGLNDGTELTIFTGRFGSGKTEVAINYALAQARARKEPRPAARGCTVALIDLDIVTPYFRTREAADALLDRGVQVIAPSTTGQFLDTPAITPQILGSLERADRPTVLDVGGDSQGARALGQFSAAIRRRGYRMHLVVNPFRPFTGTLAGLASSIDEIERSARLKVTGLVSNPNLMQETTMEQVCRGHALIEEFALQLALPIAFLAIDGRWLAELASGDVTLTVLALERFFVQPWEGEQPVTAPVQQQSALRAPAVGTPRGPNKVSP